jgi:protein-tyrosine phosphatase
MAKRGLDISGHQARKISAELLAGTSLIIGMERKHVREVATLGPSLWARSFTLPEIVHLASLVGARPKGQRLRDWAEHIGNLRDPVDYSRTDRASEIRDPMGGSVRAFRTCADIIDLRLAQLVDLAWPRPQPSDRQVAPATSGGIHADRDRR